MIIRQESEADFAAVFKTHAAAFGQEGEAKLVEALRRNKNVFVPELSLVAILDNRVVGHILFTKVKIVNDRQQAWESLALAPVAVRPDMQNSGIGAGLIRQGLAGAKALGFTSVVVLGHEHYYPKFGFVPASRWQIKAPFEVPENVFMAIELVEGGLDGISGTVQYPDEFQNV